MFVRTATFSTLDDPAAQLINSNLRQIAVRPWCGEPFKPESFLIKPNRASAQNLVLRRENPACDLTRDNLLPIIVVDEPIYRRLPAFLIVTVDKFAALPWVGQSGAFFGHVDRRNWTSIDGGVDVDI